MDKGLDLGRYRCLTVNDKHFSLARAVYNGSIGKQEGKTVNRSQILKKLLHSKLQNIDFRNQSMGCKP